MKKEIQDIINANLPAQVAGELKKHIEAQESLVEELEDAKETIKRLDKDLDVYKAKDELYATMQEIDKLQTETKDELDTRTRELDKRERGFDLELNEARMEAMESNMDNMKELVTKVFGHPSVTISSNKQKPYSDQYGTRHTDYAQDSEIKTETKA